MIDQEGRLSEWNDARGFGFITPVSGGPRVFVHISQFQRNNRRPRLNDRLIYGVKTDERGRLGAKEVRYQNQQPIESANTKGNAVIWVATAVVLGFLGLAFVLAQINSLGLNQSPTSSASVSSSVANRATQSPIQAQQSGAPMAGDGVVDRVLSDDNDGSRHQRFILRLASGQTLLIAHNIDLAPRIEALKSGDRVAFYGQYERNPEGGVIHWTHHDPEGRHASGWLKHNGVLYQ